jgi:hypothetical protein
MLVDERKCWAVHLGVHTSSEHDTLRHSRLARSEITVKRNYIPRPKPQAKRFAERHRLFSGICAYSKHIFYLKYKV